VDSGVLKSESAAQTIYQQINMISTVLACLAIPIAGKFVDTCPPYVTIPIAFLARCLATLSVLLTDTPDSSMTYVMSVLI